MTTTTITVSGMTCGHCVAAVTEEIGSLPGVTDVAVDLNAGGKSPVTIISATALDEADLRTAVDEAGYAVTSGSAVDSGAGAEPRAGDETGADSSAGSGADSSAGSGSDHRAN